ncbi:MAG: shikimate dehydrogenase [Clostridia bacterium]|nr:shikimate dehydrogenase [Clostridia bacterium]
MNITGKTIQLGVIGNPISHSISPQLHNTMAEKMGLDYTYSAYRVRRGEVAKALDGMRALNIRGFNVTIPHKVTAHDLCDELDPFAKKMGACNTLVNNDGVIKGYNTDGPGFIRSLLHKGVSVKDKFVIVLGAGGAAQGVCMAMADAGARMIGIINRTYEKAEKLAERINKYYPSVAHACNGFVDADIVVNTTSVGMNTNEMPADVDFESLKKETVVCDIVYCPRETAFLKKASEAGLKTVGGIGMLINQAVIAFELFTNTKVDETVVDYLYRMTELEKSIVLTGFMGTGKTSIGKRLCSLTGAQFIDTDSLIEEKMGMSIPDIFSKYGESCFRDVESEVIKSLAGYKGAVISTGGGAVLRRENIDTLRENGAVIFCLKADIERVFKNIGTNTESRPLLNGKTMDEARALLESRCEAYANCDEEIDVTDCEKEQSADKILELYMGRD